MDPHIILPQILLIANFTTRWVYDKFKFALWHGRRGGGRFGKNATEQSFSYSINDSDLFTGQSNTSHPGGDPVESFLAGFQK